MVVRGTMAYHSSPIYLVEAAAFCRVWIDRVKIPVRHKYLIIQILMNLTGLPLDRMGWQ